MRTSKHAQAVKHAYDKGYRVVEGVLYSHKGTKLSTNIKDRQGYLKSGVTVQGGSLQFLVHQLAAYQYFGDEWLNNPHLEVRHLDGNKTNNTRSNIALGTRRENAMDMPLEVRRLGGNPKQLTDARAGELKNRLAGFEGRLPYGMRNNLVEEFGCSKHTISNIRQGSCYKHTEVANNVRV